MANGYVDPNKKVKEFRGTVLVSILGTILLLYFSARCSYYVWSHPEESLAVALYHSVMAFTENPFSLRFDLVFFGVFFGVGAVVIFFVMMANNKKAAFRHYRDWEQCGTASWQDAKSKKEFNKQFTEPKGKPYASGPKNTIYSKTCYLSMDTRLTQMNNNSMIIGGPGSGKSYNIVRPNLLQAYGSYVVTDPSGELLMTTGKFFEERGYDIRVFNLVDMAHSHRYNPFRYLRSEDDVLTLIDCLIKNTETPGKSGGDPFWESATRSPAVKSWGTPGPCRVEN